MHGTCKIKRAGVQNISFDVKREQKWAEKRERGREG